MNNQIIKELPRRNYANYDRARQEAEKVGGELRYIIATLPAAAAFGFSPEVRFFPVFLPRDNQIQEGINLAHRGYPMVRT